MICWPTQCEAALLFWEFIMNVTFIPSATKCMYVKKNIKTPNRARYSDTLLYSQNSGSRGRKDLGSTRSARYSTFLAYIERLDKNVNLQTQSVILSTLKTVGLYLSHKDCFLFTLGLHDDESSIEVVCVIMSMFSKIQSWTGCHCPISTLILN